MSVQTALIALLLDEEEENECIKAKKIWVQSFAGLFSKLFYSYQNIYIFFNKDNITLLLVSISVF